MEFIFVEIELLLPYINITLLFTVQKFTHQDKEDEITYVCLKSDDSMVAQATCFFDLWRFIQRTIKNNTSGQTYPYGQCTRSPLLFLVIQKGHCKEVFDFSSVGKIF